MLEQKLKKMGEENLEVSLIYKSNLNGFAASVTWRDPEHSYTLRTERLIKFEELFAPISIYADNIFEFSLSNILGNMAGKVLKEAKRYKTLIGENI